jgi:hypothetical protein
MSIKISLVLLTIFLFGCKRNPQNNFTQTTTENKITVDTIVGSKSITDEIAGSAYRKRAIGYFVIIDKDTSDYTCIFTESKDGGEVDIDFIMKNFKADITYRQRLDELKIVLPKAAADFNFDSLKGIYFGQLVFSGDLTVDVPKQYQQKVGINDKCQSYPAVGQLLKESKFGVDLDNLFKPYSVTVDNVSIEKHFFTSTKDHYLLSGSIAVTLKRK